MGRLEPVEKLLLVLLVPAGSLVLVGKLVLVEYWCWWKTGADEAWRF